MTVTLNHTIVPALDNQEDARFFAPSWAWSACRRPAPTATSPRCRVNDELTLDFMTVEDPAGHHLAFDVDPYTFDQILARIRELDVPFGNGPVTAPTAASTTRCAPAACSSPTPPATCTRSCPPPEGATSDEERLGGGALGQRVHRRLVRARGVPGGGVEHAGQQTDVADAVDEDPGRLSAHQTARSMSSCFWSGSYQVDRRVRPVAPVAQRDRLDRLHRDAALLAGRVERVEVLGVVAGSASSRSCRAAAPSRSRSARGCAGAWRRSARRGRSRRCGGRGPARAPRRGLQRAAGAERDVPLDGVGQVVQLQQVDVVDPHPLQRAVQLVARRRPRRALAGLRGQEEPVRLRVPASGSSRSSASP